ncbi:MAG: hypothetical protein HY675_27500 [Chloroflexi bacterium]|nr:hypothetical protein [Chloroflexota bacterium]
MARFLFGLIIGAIAAVWLSRSRYPEEVQLDQRLSDVQKKAEAVLTESRHILQETRGELVAAMESARESVQEKAERLKTAAMEPEPAPHREETASRPIPSPSKVE